MYNITFYDQIEDEKLGFAVIIARSDNKWVICKHRERNVFEMPGGHRESGEDILTTARRELYEETGALDYTIFPICIYAIKHRETGEEKYGMLFYADITSFEPELHSEIEKIYLMNDLPDRWRFPTVYPALVAEAKRRNIPFFNNL